MIKQKWCNKRWNICIYYNSWTFVKRIQKVDGKLDIISDNKDYPSQIFKKNDLEILGKVIKLFGMVY